jgi:hypothetical protein
METPLGYTNLLVVIFGCRLIMNMHYVQYEPFLPKSGEHTLSNFQAASRQIHQSYANTTINFSDRVSSVLDVS